jgi:putative ABC transport system permease protein
VRTAGVAPNFYFRFFEDADEPVVFHYNPSEFRVATARVAPEQSRTALDSLGATWRQFDATNPLDAGFYEDLVRTRFVAPLADAGGALSLVAALAVLIGCLGLLGIAAYTVQTRTREIGIRKALGATVSSVVGLLSADFLWLVGAAVAVGLPAAWWLNRLWLQNLAFRIELTAFPFVASAAGLIGLALLAVGSQTIQAARTDPARTLRDE